MTVGIICEYNPLHLGHKKQIDRIRAVFGPETAFVCAMSGNFVQRGMPAIIHKSFRAKAAWRAAGKDLPASSSRRSRGGKRSLSSAWAASVKA